MKRTFISLVCKVLLMGLVAGAEAYSIRDDATGGDCTLIGTWDNTLKTCTLTVDINTYHAEVSIDSDGITLDGNGHSLNGVNWYDKGVSVNYRIGVAIKNLIFNNHHWGIYLWGSSDAKIIGNAFNGSFVGISAWLTDSSVITNNTHTNNYIGMVIGGSNEIYNNNFIKSRVLSYMGNSIFNLPAPTGGNYWSTYDEPTENCNDLDSDGFCDMPFYFTGGVDFLPYIERDGWLPRAAIEIDPDTLNKRSNSGRNSITVYIEMPDYDIGEIDINSLTLNGDKGAVSAQTKHAIVGDYDYDGIPDLMVKFNRQEVLNVVSPGNIKMSLNRSSPNN